MSICLREVDCLWSKLGHREELSGRVDLEVVIVLAFIYFLLLFGGVLPDDCLLLLCHLPIELMFHPIPEDSPPQGHEA